MKQSSLFISITGNSIIIAHIQRVMGHVQLAMVRFDTRRIAFMLGTDFSRKRSNVCRTENIEVNKYREAGLFKESPLSFAEDDSGSSRLSYKLEDIQRHTKYRDTAHFEEQSHCGVWPLAIDEM